MLMERRRLLLAAPVLPLAVLAGPAEAETTDLILNCDTALAAPMAEAADRFRKSHGVRVNVFPTPPGLILPQIARHIQNDMVMTRSSAVSDAITMQTIAKDAPQGGQWQNALVIAGRADATSAALHGRIAVSDATPGSDMNGPAILQQLKLGQNAVSGVIDTDEVVYLLLRGDADAGLLHLSDIRANPGLKVLTSVPPDVAPPVTYTIAVTKLSRRPHPEAFIDFLTSGDGTALLHGAGLERVA